MTRSAVHLLRAGWLALVLAAGSAWADETAQDARRPIPFRSDPTPIEDHGPRIAIVVVIVLGLALAGMYVVRRRWPRLALPARTERRLQVLEQTRLNPRCTLYLVRLDDKEALLAQCGDNVVFLNPGDSLGDGLRTPAVKSDAG
jgi:hypothetical protein